MPRAHPGAGTALELRAGREQHRARVRRLLAELDVFAFTLGLTATWAAAADRAVCPVCPGVPAGRFDPERHVLQNHGVDDVVDDLDPFLTLLRSINPGAAVAPTVSPAPLVATALDRHVMVYSTSVLRVAAKVLTQRHECVACLASYEIVAGSFHRGACFAPDGRSVTEARVAHVMRLFLHHCLGLTAAPGAVPSDAADRFLADAAEVVRVRCDEETLGRRGVPTPA